MPGRVFAFRWAVAGFVPLCAIAAAVLVLEQLFRLDDAAPLTHFVLPLAAGGAQAAVLRAHGVATKSWFWRTVVGWSVGAFVGVVIMATLDGLGPEEPGILLGMTVLGTTLGTAQALALRGAAPNVSRWALASAAAWMVYGALSVVAGLLAHRGLRLSSVLPPLTRLYESGHAEAVLLSVGLAATGVMTAPFIGRLLRTK